MDDKLVSIIIRTKNEEKWISSCLRSVFNQTYKNIEVILVDNESTDKTVVKASAFPVRLVTIKDFLPGKAINDGIRVSTGEYLVCLSGHCVPSDNRWLENLIQDLKETNIAGVYGKQEPLSFTSDLDKRDLLTVFGLDKKIQVKDTFFHNANSAFRRDIWEKYPFDETVTNIEDRVWGERVVSDGLNIVYEPSASVYHWHGIHQDLNPDRAKNIVRILESLDSIDTKAAHDDPKDLKILCVIPVKGESRIINGVPLISHTINSAQSSKYVNDIVVSSDNKNTCKIAKDLGVEAPFLRPKSLSEEFVDILQVLEYTLEKLEGDGRYYDIVVLLEETYPFRERDVVDKMIVELLAEGSDTVLAAVSESRGIWKKNINTGDLSNIEDDIFMPSSLKDSKTMISLLGFCCVMHTSSLHDNMVLSGNIGLVEIDNPLSVITVKNDREALLAEMIVKNKIFSM